MLILFSLLWNSLSAQLSSICCVVEVASREPSIKALQFLRSRSLRAKRMQNSFLQNFSLIRSHM